MNKISCALIIHGMAVLHALVTLFCMLGGVPDTLILTLLTMTMTVLLCLKKELPVDFSAITVVLVNVFGFALGNWGARLFNPLIPNEIAPHVLATFLTTEILGWGFLLFIRLFSVQNSHRGSWSRDIGWLVAAVAIVFVLRVGIDLLSSGEPTGQTIQVVMEISAISLIFVIYFAARMRNQAEIEREKTHQAEFRYMTLKQQVNPHFLFNSLNILDALVQESSRADASKYIHKLAGIYRYMLQHEGESLVRLSEEMEFVRMFIDLMQLRFPKGLEVKMDIPEEELQHHVVPCAVQLLVENAIKHNTISEDNPLTISIETDGSSITVQNNVIPRLSPSQSTGLGQNYIVQQYKDKTESQVQIMSTDQQYSVTLPLL